MKSKMSAKASGMHSSWGEKLLEDSERATDLTFTVGAKWRIYFVGVCLNNENPVEKFYLLWFLSFSKNIFEAYFKHHKIHPSQAYTSIIFSNFNKQLNYHYASVFEHSSSLLYDASHLFTMNPTTISSDNH